MVIAGVIDRVAWVKKNHPHRRIGSTADDAALALRDAGADAAKKSVLVWALSSTTRITAGVGIPQVLGLSVTLFRRTNPKSTSHPLLMVVSVSQPRYGLARVVSPVWWVPDLAGSEEAPGDRY